MQLSNVARFMPRTRSCSINKAMGKYTDLKLGELLRDGLQLRDLIAKEASEAGKSLAVFSQAKRLVNTVLAISDKSKKNIEDEMEEAFAEVNKLKKSEPLKYGQSIWKRLLVSSATTMINVAGFGQYYVGQTVADLFNFGMLSMKAMAQRVYNPNAAEKQCVKLVPILRYKHRRCVIF